MAVESRELGLHEEVSLLLGDSRVGNDGSPVFELGHLGGVGAQSDLADQHVAAQLVLLVQRDLQRGVVDVPRGELERVALLKGRLQRVLHYGCLVHHQTRRVVVGELVLLLFRFLFIVEGYR